MRYWRELDPDKRFLTRSRIPCDTPPSSLEEPHSAYISSKDDHFDDCEDEGEPDEPGEAMMASPSALQVVDMPMSPTKIIFDSGCTKVLGPEPQNHFCQHIDGPQHLLAV